MYNVTFDTHENTSATDTSYSISIPHMERAQCNSPDGVCVLAGRFFRFGLVFGGGFACLVLSLSLFFF